ncbi:MAG: FixH family protein [Pseudomonadota bacterium]
MIKELKGHHVLVIAVTAFAVVLTANLVMMFSATGTFPGLVVRNSYVASQGWNAKTDAQRALGWHADIDYRDGLLRVALTDAGGEAVRVPVSVLIGRPSSDAEDRTVALTPAQTGHAAPIDLAPGIWRLHVMTASPVFEVETRLIVPEAN